MSPMARSAGARPSRSPWHPRRPPRSRAARAPTPTRATSARSSPPAAPTRTSTTARRRRPSASPTPSSSSRPASTASRTAPRPASTAAAPAPTPARRPRRPSPSRSSSSPPRPAPASSTTRPTPVLHLPRDGPRRRHHAGRHGRGDLPLPEGGVHPLPARGPQRLGRQRRPDHRGEGQDQGHHEVGWRDRHVPDERRHRLHPEHRPARLHLPPPRHRGHQLRGQPRALRQEQRHDRGRPRLPLADPALGANTRRHPRADICSNSRVTFTEQKLTGRRGDHDDRRGRPPYNMRLCASLARCQIYHNTRLNRRVLCF